MPRAVFMVGIPGSGKSKYAGTLGMPVVSSDTLREQKTGSHANLSQDKEVWQKLWNIVEATLRAGGDIVIDSTNTLAERRDRDVAFCKALGESVVVEAYWIDTPLDTCLARNKARPKPVPEEKIREMHARLMADPPREGKDHFAKVYRITG